MYSVVFKYFFPQYCNIPYQRLHGTFIHLIINWFDAQIKKKKKWT